MPDEITEEFYDKALFLVYYEYTDSNGDKVMCYLPYIGFDAASGLSYTYTFDITPGTIAFKLMVEDFKTDVVVPPTEARQFYISAILP
jgi:hypothetical protein